MVFPHISTEKRGIKYVRKRLANAALSPASEEVKNNFVSMHPMTFYQFIMSTLDSRPGPFANELALI